MRSMRLQGHTIDDARERLVGGSKIQSKPEPKPKDGPIFDIENQADIPTIALDNENGAVEMAKESKDKVPAWKLHKHLRWWWQGSSKQRALLVGLVVLLLAGSGYGLFLVFHKSPPPPKPPAAAVIQEPPKPTTVASPLTGIQVAPDLANRPVTGIMIENSLDARPQSGLQDAGVVFEAIAEGGITRFIALFQEATPQYIGPVRSVRPYYLDWAAAFNASVAHIGGSPVALEQVRSGMRDLDQFFNSGAYWRQPTRYAPHNVYTSFAKLDALNKSKGYRASHFTSWERKDEKKLAVPTAKSIDLNISSYNWNVHYDYDAKSNSYFRYEGGQPHMSTTSAKDTKGRQLHPKVLVVMVMSYGLAADFHHSQYGDIGSGRAYVFQDGGVTKGFWKKTGVTTQLLFYTSDGKTIKLDPGQTWVTALSAENQLIYK